METFVVIAMTVLVLLSVLAIGMGVLYLSLAVHKVFATFIFLLVPPTLWLVLAESE